MDPIHEHESESLAKSRDLQVRLVKGPPELESEHLPQGACAR